MKTVTVGYFAILREQRGLSSETISTAANTYGELYEELKVAHGFKLSATLVRPAANEKFCEHGDALNEGDHVVFIPPVAGG